MVDESTYSLLLKCALNISYFRAAIYVSGESLSLTMKCLKRKSRLQLTHTHFHNYLGEINSYYISDYNKLVEDKKCRI
jgi:hypothetical protein